MFAAKCVWIRNLIVMTLRQRQTKFWLMIAQLIFKGHILQTPFFISEWGRSLAQQKLNVAKKLSKTMKSKHLDGLAVDIIFLSDVDDDGVVNFSPDKYRELGEYWESIGGEWGGRYGDDPDTKKIEGWDSGHFQEKD